MLRLVFSDWNMRCTNITPERGLGDTCTVKYQQPEELDKRIIPILILQTHHRLFQVEKLTPLIELVPISPAISSRYMRGIPSIESFYLIVPLVSKSQVSNSIPYVQEPRTSVVPILKWCYSTLFKDSRPLHIDSHCMQHIPHFVSLSSQYLTVIWDCNGMQIHDTIIIR